MNLTKLNCPSCGATLELPDNLTVAHCIYCGNKIFLDQDRVASEHRDLERYLELCKVAVEAQNHDEVIQYSNRILEIDPKNVEAWIHKATSTFWLTTAANNRYDEAMEYLKKASETAPVDDRIPNARAAITLLQALWYNKLGIDKWNYATQTYNIYYEPFYADEARQQSHDAIVEAMNCFLTAADFAPENVFIIENIAKLAKEAKWIRWSDKVHNRINSLRSLRAKN